nr:OmpA family protein [uncultured Capnocytophaga sp.]
MNHILKKGILFILAFVPSIIYAQEKLYKPQKEIVLSKEELQLLLQKVAEAKMRKIRSEKLADLHKSQQKKAVSNIYNSNEVKNFYYLAQNTDSTYTDIEQVNRKLDILLAYMMKKDSISVIHLTDTVKYVANNKPNSGKYTANNPNKVKIAANNKPNTVKQTANNPNMTKNVANNTPNKDALLQKQLDAIAKSIADLSNQQKILAAAVVPLATLNNKGKLNKIQQSVDSLLLVSKKQADNVQNHTQQHTDSTLVSKKQTENNVQSHKEPTIAVQNIKEQDSKGSNTVISEERRRTLEDLLAKYGHKKTPIYFANNAYTPLSLDTQAIEQIVAMLRDNPELSILLEGYASNVGSSEYNNHLSMRRSESVAHLLQKQGIALQRILTAFRGIDDSVDIEKARRVDISVIIR